MVKHALHILADENIPAVQQCFADIGRIVSVPGRAITAADLKDVDVLLLRSVTRIDENLLAGSRVQFVGSATIGIDHVDIDYLKQANIQFAHAPGSNARSVVEYVLAALACLRPEFFSDSASRFAVLGFGNVGSRLATVVKSLGHEVYVCDPFVAPAPGFTWCGLEEALACEMLSIHVPLTSTGDHHTFHLLNSDRLKLRPTGGVLINTSRGAVVDNAALKQILDQGFKQNVVLDVWENEPVIDRELLHDIAIATPHIAGYAADGKVRGTLMLRQALLGFLQLERADDSSHTSPDTSAYTELPSVSIAVEPGDTVADVILKAYPISEDDKRLREEVPGATTMADYAERFDALRKHYPVRREWQRLQISGKLPDDEIRNTLTRLGFSLPV